MDFKQNGVQRETIPDLENQMIQKIYFKMMKFLACKYEC